MSTKSTLKITIISVTIIWFLSIQMIAQDFKSSNLPIFLIYTKYDPITGKYEEIQDDPRIIADLKIIKRPGENVRNYVTDMNTDEFLNYNGKIDIEIRGSSSQVLPKKQYGFSTKKSDGTTNNNVSLLGMPADNDWILNSLAFDPSLVRDFFCYNLYNSMGNYTTRTQYCEVVLNGNYLGLYVLQEKLKQGAGRINVTKIKSTELNLPEVSGGYIIKADKIDSWAEVGWTMKSYSPPDNDVEYVAVLPKYDEIKTQQLEYIKNIFLNLETQAKLRNIDLITGFPSIIDIKSFVDYMLISELSANVDSYQYSTFFNKERDGKLRAGPIWDSNLTFGNDLFFWGLDRSWINTWQFNNGDNEGSYYWKDLFNTTRFKCYLTKRWKELRSQGNAFDINKMYSLLDSAKIKITEASLNENIRWGTVPNINGEIQLIKNFISDRINWMNNQFESTSACEGVAVPPVVISKIHYNPATSTNYPTSWSQEFIEISNISAQDQDLTGVFFSGIGFSYLFPKNSKIKALNSLFLARDTTVFRKKYNRIAFGKFNINLPDNSQKLILSDAWGNSIDYVEYSSSAPWPDAFQNGYYLNLKDKNKDNNDPLNWEIQADNFLVHTIREITEKQLLYPNPTNGVITLPAGITSDKIEIFNSLGQKTNFNKPDETIIDISGNLPGIYFIIIKGNADFDSYKIILQ
jgi:hypothetical protein